MRRRSRAGGEPAKAQRRKTGARKSRITPKAVHPRSSSAAREETKVARLTRERDEAFQQQRATADVLKVISRSAFNLQAVLKALTVSAVRLCAADLGFIFQQDGDVLRLVADFGVSREAERYLRRAPRARWPGERVRARPIGRQGNPYSRRAGRSRIPSDARSGIGRIQKCPGVPLLRDGTTIGVFGLGRREPNPFTEKQIDLVTNFADQAAIAIENARLFEAEQQRSRELAESLKQQTATSDVLQVISRSAFDLDAVLNTLVESASRVCEADRGVIIRPTREGASYHSAASYGHTPEYDEYIKTLIFTPGRDTLTGRVLLAGKSVQIADVLADAEWAHAHPGAARTRQLSHNARRPAATRGDTYWYFSPAAG